MARKHGFWPRWCLFKSFAITGAVAATFLVLSPHCLAQHQQLDQLKVCLSHPSLANLGLTFPPSVIPPGGIHQTIHPPGNPTLTVTEDIDASGNGGLSWTGTQSTGNAKLIAWKMTWSDFNYFDNNHKKWGETELDAAGSGFVKAWWGLTGQLTSESHFLNGIADGICFRQMFPGLTMAGQFDNGKPVGLWYFTGTWGQSPQSSQPVKWKLDMKNGSAYWAVPNIYLTQVSYTGPVFLEAGMLVNGLPEGYWYDGSQETNGQYVFVSCGNWHNGKKTGAWQYYEGEKLRISVTFSNGVVCGPFNGYRDGAIVSGNFSGMPGQDVSTSSGPWAFSIFNQWDASMRLSGDWKYYGPNGALLSESDLTNGTGPFRELNWTGRIREEGNVVAGSPDGDWIEYDWWGVPVFKKTFKNGQLINEVNISPPFPVVPVPH